MNPIKKPTWYGSARWKQRRADQLSAYPLCKMCELRGKVVAAKVADHRIPHKGNPNIFWNGELDSLCKSCHDGDKQRMERGGKAKPVIGLDGWPV
jgi:5-methylcytosine-specific restriction enzyme A